MKLEKLYTKLLEPFVKWALLAFGVSLLIKWANAGVGGALSSMPNVIGQSLGLAAIIVAGIIHAKFSFDVGEKAAKIIERQWSSEAKFATRVAALLGAGLAIVPQAHAGPCQIKPSGATAVATRPTPNRDGAAVDTAKLDTEIAQYTKAIEVNATDVLAFFNRGNRYADKVDHDRAIADYTKVIEIDPNYAAAYNNRGASYAAVRDRDRAIADYSKAIEIDPNFATAYFNRGVAYSEKGQTELAKKDFEQARELDPEIAGKNK